MPRFVIISFMSIVFTLTLAACPGNAANGPCSLFLIKLSRLFLGEKELASEQPEILVGAVKTEPAPIAEPVIEASPYDEDALHVEVSSEASFAFLQPVEGFDIYQLKKSLENDGKDKNKYKFMVFEKENIIALIDNTGSSHSAMEMFLHNYGYVSLETREETDVKINILGGSRIKNYSAGPTVLESDILSRYGNGLDVHSQIFSGLVITAFANIRTVDAGDYIRNEDGSLSPPRLGYYRYVWTVKKSDEYMDEIVGTHELLVEEI